MKRRRITVLIVVLLIALFSATPVFGVIAQPDSGPTASFYVYRNLLVTGDWLILIYQNIPYAVTPASSVTEAFMWRLMDTTGTTEYAACQPVAWNDNGYGYNVASIYLDSGNVSALGLTWNTAYVMRLSESPPFFAAPVDFNHNLSAADYSTLTTRADVREALKSRILVMGADLDIAWGLGATYSLLNETETGTVLSNYGEAFFRAAIYGLQGLCPNVFAYVIEDLNLTDRTWTSTYVTTLEDQYHGTWADTAKNAGKALFGTAYDLTALLITLLAAGVVGGIVIAVSGDAWHGYADARTVLIAMTRLGFFSLGFLGLLAALAVIYGASRLWGVMR